MYDKQIERHNLFCVADTSALEISITLWTMLFSTLITKHTAFIFAVGKVDPQSSGREERQRDGQTTALLQTPKNT